MLDIKKVLTAKPKPHEDVELARLMTPWGEKLDQDNPLSEHPVPQAQRDGWSSLNGAWRCRFVQASGGCSQFIDACRSACDAKAPVALFADMDELDFTEAQDIVVPFSPEAPLSGVGRQLQPSELLWYARTFDAPDIPNEHRLVLHFVAVDYACAVWMNGHLMGTHVGGYTPFAFDITDVVQPIGNRLMLCVADPSETGTQLRGKQRLSCGDIWYTAQSGIWQSVWLEWMPAQHVGAFCLDASYLKRRLRIDAEVSRVDSASSANCGIVEATTEDCVEAVGDGGRGLISGLRGSQPVRIGESGVGFGMAIEGNAPVAGSLMAEVGMGFASSFGEFGYEASRSDEESAALELVVTLYDADGCEVAFSHGIPDRDGKYSCVIAVPDPMAWSPEDPYLYKVVLAYGDDRVESYVGFRDVEVRADAQGVPRVHLNGRPIFLKGVLDQGYWPDGLMTAPADAALVYDIEQARTAGFNMMRKHIKVENPRWYYHCDRIGMLVWQDMVSGGDVWNTWYVSYKPALFKSSWDHYDDRPVQHQANLLAKDAAYQREWTSTMRATIELLQSHPSVITWVLFNEGWGQFDARAALEAARELDPTRPVDAVSGWYDQRCGDFKSVHNYFRPLEVWPDQGRRAFVVSEFGGLALGIVGHTSLPEAYGYSAYEDADAWRRSVREVLARMDALETAGLAGYVYTQLSDVEEEVNGILTYDRRVSKLDDRLR